MIFIRKYTVLQEPKQYDSYFDDITLWSFCQQVISALVTSINLVLFFFLRPVFWTAGQGVSLF